MIFNNFTFKDQKVRINSSDNVVMRVSFVLGVFFLAMLSKRIIKVQCFGLGENRTSRRKIHNV